MRELIIYFHTSFSTMSEESRVQVLTVTVIMKDFMPHRWRD